MVITANQAARPETSVPNPAGVYDYWLGGKKNSAADRVFADHSVRLVPQLPWLARKNRSFMSRAVRFCANAGITQFLDIGCGLLTEEENVHQIAGQVATDPHVVYVDNDPAVVIDTQAQLSDPYTLSICADLTHPDGIIGHRDVRRLIDFSQPVAIFVVFVMHVIPDEADPAGLVARLRDVMAPGSYLAISHVEFSRNHLVGNQPLNQTTRELCELRKGLPSAHARTREEITSFFGDLTLVEPGLVDVWAWPDTDCIVTMKDVLDGDQIGWKAMTILGGVGRKDCSRIQAR